MTAHATPLPEPLCAGSVAVITGAASGIGLATAGYLAERGVHIILADLPGPALSEALEKVRKLGAVDHMAVPTDVADFAQVEALRDRTLDRFGTVTLLMNNAGTRSTEAKPWEDHNEWRRVLDTNLWGAVNGVQAFAPQMIRSGERALIVTTGSKQGITLPPGRGAYNLSKAALNSFATMLAHDMRIASSGRITTHLLIPGHVWTGMAGPLAPKPDGAWAAEQVPPFLFDGIADGDFYILCPDNAVDRTTDEARIRWATDDIIYNRPALSRWHPDHVDDFVRFMARSRIETDG